MASAQFSYLPYYRQLTEDVKRMKCEVNRSGKSSETVMKSAQVTNSWIFSLNSGEWLTLFVGISVKILTSKYKD